MLSTLWNLVWYSIVIFLFVAYLVILFQIVSDLFRDHTTSGAAKILWIIGLVVLPYLTAFIYLLARGKGMSERSAAAHRNAVAAAEDYIRDTAGTSPAAQIADAKALLDAGTISAQEFDALKQKALS